MSAKIIFFLICLLAILNGSLFAQLITKGNIILEVEMSCEPLKESESNKKDGEIELIVYSRGIDEGELMLSGQGYDSSFQITTNESYSVKKLSPGKYYAYFKGEGVIDSSYVIIEERVIYSLEECECIKIGFKTDKLAYWMSSNGTESLEGSQPIICPQINTEYSLTLTDGFDGDIEKIVNYSIIIGDVEIKMNRIPQLLCDDISEVEVYTKNKYKSYKWSTGDTTSSIRLLKGGEFTLEVESYDSCLMRKSFIVSDEKNDPCMEKYLGDRGFSSEICKVNYIHDLSNDKTSEFSSVDISIEILSRFGRSIPELKLNELSQLLVDDLKVKNIELVVFITSNIDICSGKFERVGRKIDSSRFRNVLWMHVCDKQDYGTFFYKTDFQDDINFIGK